MASQSPSVASTAAQATGAAASYLDSWQAIGALLREGRSWSGHERNCCFLNTASPRFADVATISGLDQLADSRGVASVDWDQDGDLDLWVSNRTAPRVRFLRNDTPRDYRFLSIKLEGTASNRDAIGARVEVICQGPTEPLRQVETLRAGEGYLSQSSKWLHFGLGNHDEVQQLVVHWPSGAKSRFENVKPNRFYHLVEGATLTHVQQNRRIPALKLSTPRVRSNNQAIRIVAHQPLPLPPLHYLRSHDQQVLVNAPSDRFRLLVLWATWCRPCLEELQEYVAAQQEFEQANLQLIPINVDQHDGDLAMRQMNASQALGRIGYVGTTSGLASIETVDLLDSIQRCLTAKQDSLAVPCSFLLDPAGRLTICYKGSVPVGQLVADVHSMAADRSDPREVAVPLPGRWFTAPVPTDLLAIPQSLVNVERATTALDYLKTHVISPADGERLPVGVDAKRLSDLLARTGITLTKQRKASLAISALQLAARFDPSDWNATAALATLLQQQGRIREALSEHRKTLRLRPNHPAAANNIAWILATSPDPAIRDPEEAVRQAEGVCRQSGYRLPEALDTLAAAYAAAGRFDDASSMAKRAIALAESQSDGDKVLRIQHRLRLYESGRPFFDSTLR